MSNKYCKAGYNVLLFGREDIKRIKKDKLRLKRALPEVNYEAS